MLVDLTIVIFCTIAIASLGALVYSRSPQQTINRRFALLSASIVAWTISNFLSDNATTSVLLYTQLTFLFGTLTIFSLIQFITHFPNETLFRGSRFIQVHSILTVLLVVGVFLPEFISSVTLTSNGGMIETGYLYYLFILYVAYSLLVLIPLAIVRQYRYTKSIAEKRQVLTISWGIILYAVFSVISNVVLPFVINSWTSSRFGPAFALILAASVAYAIAKHRLFDIKLAAVRSLAYIGVLLTLSGFYYLIAYLLSMMVFGGHMSDLISVSPVNIFLALILAFLFQPIKRFFDKVTEDIFYQDVYSSEVFFAELSQLLISTTDLRGLLERASQQMATTFKSEQAFFYLYYSNESDHHMSAGTKSHARLPIYDARLLDAYATTSKHKVLLADLVADNTVRRMLQSHKVALVMPLWQGDQIIGYVMLGDHRSSNYSKRDLNVLSTISNELVIAIQNALSLHEVKELNATLQQRIDVATKELRSSNAQLKHLDEVKDEFMSMASHQLRTPLTSIKGYMSMVLEGDLGEISPQQRKVLGEAFNSSERMVRLIADFLNVSRLQTGKFLIEKTPFDLNKAVEQEVNSLHLMASTHDLSIKLHLPKGTVPIVADEAKIRQVIMNFVDNAVYYSMAGGTVTIHVALAASGVDVTVSDSGIGVPIEEQARLFNKFFRATNARRQRPDGTGVGLYLAKKVITAHGGSMIFHSAEGKGSTFGFHLPPTHVPLPHPVEAEQLSAPPTIKSS